MEEILASIRRIIEDSDVEKRRDVDDSVPSLAPAANDVLQSATVAETFQVDFREEDFVAELEADDRQESVAELVHEPIRTEPDAVMPAKASTLDEPQTPPVTVAASARPAEMDPPAAAVAATQSDADTVLREPVAQATPPQSAGEDPAADFPARP